MSVKKCGELLLTQPEWLVEIIQWLDGGKKTNVALWGEKVAYKDWISVFYFIVWRSRAGWVIKQSRTALTDLPGNVFSALTVSWIYYRIYLSSMHDSTVHWFIFSTVYLGESNKKLIPTLMHLMQPVIQSEPLWSRRAHNNAEHGVVSRGGESKRQLGEGWWKIWAVIRNNSKCWKVM